MSKVRQNTQNIWLGHPATSEEVYAICQHKAFRIGYQAALHGVPFSPDLFVEELDQRRYEEGREVALMLMLEGMAPEWPLERRRAPWRLVEVILGENLAAGV